MNISIRSVLAYSVIASGTLGCHGGANLRGDRGATGATGANGVPGADGLPGADAEGGCTCIVATGGDIQACVDDVCAKGGGSVCLEAGDFETSGVEIACSNIDLRGQGWSTVVRLADAAYSTVIFLGDKSGASTVTGLRVSNLAVDGNKSGNPNSETDANGQTINAIGIGWAEDVEIEDVLVEDARSGGIVTLGAVSGLKLEGVTVRGSTFDGLAFNDTSDIMVSGCLLEQNLYAGISADWGLSGIISGNVLTGNGAGEDGTGGNPGIYLAGLDGLLLANNFIENSSGNAVMLTDSQTGAGCATNVILDGNMLVGSGAYGVWVAQPACSGVGIHTCYQHNLLGDLLDGFGVFTEIEPVCE